MRNTVYALLGLMMMLLVAPLQAQPAEAPAAWTLEWAVLNTAAQGWEYSGKNDQVFSDMVRDMVALSALNRGLTLPDDKRVGELVGQVVTREARADPDKLLYAIVDHAVTTSLGCLVPASLSTPVPASEAISDWTLSEVSTSTVNQAWQMSGQSRPEFMKMVNQILAMDLENRGWALSDTKEAGTKFGEILRADIEAHPNDLLYTVVDRSLCQYMAMAPPKQ